MRLHATNTGPKATIRLLNYGCTVVIKHCQYHITYLSNRWRRLSTNFVSMTQTHALSWMSTCGLKDVQRFFKFLHLFTKVRKLTREIILQVRVKRLSAWCLTLIGALWRRAKVRGLIAPYQNFPQDLESFFRRYVQSSPSKKKQFYINSWRNMTEASVRLMSYLSRLSVVRFWQLWWIRFSKFVGLSTTDYSKLW